MPNPIRAATTYAQVTGKVLCKLRNQKRIGQTDMARAVGVSQSTWSKIENGQSPLAVDQLARAAGALKVRPDEILAMVQQSIQNIERKGVAVEHTRELGSGLMEIKSAALAGLIVLPTSQKKV